jgi:glycosyltransferase involved in cell wall biosynthesis
MRSLRTSDGRRARVLHVGKFYPPYKGGMETHLQDLCRAIAPFADVSVLASNDKARTVHEFDGAIPVERSASWAKVASAPICPGMIRAIRNARADIVHLHCPNPMAVVSCLASGHSGKIVITYQSDIIRQRILRYAYEPWFNRVAAKAQAIVCLSPNYIDSSPTLHRFREKCHVIPHGIDADRFQQLDEGQVESIRARYGDNIILAVGRLVYYKGFEYLIRAAARAKANLLIIGTGPMRERLLQVARECGSADRVHLLGEVEDVIPYYRAARVFALSSIARSEAFGIVQLEAMACGTPVVNTCLDTGVPFVSLDGISGLTVPTADVPALQHALTRILDDANLRAHFSAGAIHRVRQYFTLEAMAEKTLQLYEQILSDVTVRITEPELITAAV